MIELLESSLLSYKQTKRILTIRKQQSKLVVIDEKILYIYLNHLKKHLN